MNPLATLTWSPANITFAVLGVVVVAILLFVALTEPEP